MIFGILIVVSMNASAQQSNTIPSWIKNTALWWGQGQISDAEFIKAIQWLINEGIITLPSISPTSNQQETSSNQKTTSMPQSYTPVTGLAAYLPNVNDLGSQWQGGNIQPHSQFFEGYNSVKSVDSTYLKLAGSQQQESATVDIAQFDADNTARQVFSSYTQYWQQQHFIQWPFDTNSQLLSCSGIMRTTIQSTDITLMCIEGKTLLAFDVNGNGIGMADDMNEFANITFKKIPLDVALQ
jgi:hypothetical protein